MTTVTLVVFDIKNVEITFRTTLNVFFKGNAASGSIFKFQ